MTDRELLKQIDDLLNKKVRWSGNPNFNDKKAYVTFVIRDYVDIVNNLSNQLKHVICERCGEINPAEIHTCTPTEIWLAVEAEREACAQAAELVVPRHTECGNKIARAIRARGQR